MKEFFSNAFSGIALNDIIDILIVAFVIYKLLGLIKQTRAEQLLKGVVVLVVATFVTDLLKLHTINWLLKGTVALGAVAILSEEENRGKIALFGGVKNARFKRQVRPGDVLELRCELTQRRGPIGSGVAEATVDGQVACRAELTFAIQ